ncbi:MFS transporter [Cupriavidus basilensis]|uniref:MFS transporter n=1 Tax=Cupriavidus basilensis TaxID=68895 RepID=UPI0020A6B3F5|nr:MFS transporter [Cupriavidus basilensis]MCP3018404.1 MFS transporter [Cupriavidus basilensis]
MNDPQAGTAGTPAAERGSAGAAGAAGAAGSPWSPLRHSTFRMLWIATVASNVGTWMNDVGASWLMTSLDPDPLMVALVQAAGSLPMFLFALPSGVLADIVDRRKYLIFAQLWTLAVATTLGVLALTGLVNAHVLLLAAFLLSTGAAMSSPPFQAIVPDLVDKADLPPAIALNSLGINISRAIGPALGGLILSFSGPAVVFLLNALSVLGVTLVLYRWKAEPARRNLPSEHFFSAVRAGLRYVEAAPLLRVVLVRAVAFFLFGSAGWALLPLVARQELGLGPGGYGLLLASIGLGAVGGALVLPKLRGRVLADRMVVLASLLFALSLLALAYVRHFWLLAAALLFAGLAWIAVLSTLNVAAQRSAAGWVKARALAAYLTVFFGAMTAGSALWGKTAALLGIPVALVLAAAGLVLACATALRWRLDISPDLDLAPSGFLHPGELDVAHDRGPVMICVEYEVAREDAAAFAKAVQEMRRIRRRSGALSWGVYEDLAVPGRFIETFLVESWLEHLRQHERHTMNDKLIQTRVHRFHRGAAPPVVRHLAAPDGN